MIYYIILLMKFIVFFIIHFNLISLEDQNNRLGKKVSFSEEDNITEYFIDENYSENHQYVKKTNFKEGSRRKPKKILKKFYENCFESDLKKKQKKFSSKKKFLYFGLFLSVIYLIYIYKIYIYKRKK